MTPIEQAREALTRIAELTPGKANAMTAFGLHYSVKAIAETALAALSRPVEGVKGEPRVKPLEWENTLDQFSADDGNYYIMRWHTPDGELSHFEYEGEDYLTLVAAQHAAQADHERCILSALADPEAEARLRERVAELEQQFDGLKASRDDNLDLAGRWKARAEAAEARLAQAEGGPASDYEEHIRNDKGDIVAYRDDAGNVGWVGTLKAEGGPAVTEAIRAILDDDDADVYEKLGDIRAALSHSTRKGKTE